MTIFSGDSDAVLDLLRHPERRYVVDALVDGPETVDLGTLAEQLMQRPYPADVFERDLEMRLHHVHLPKLAKYGLIRYDPQTHTVRLRCRPAGSVLDRATKVRAEVY